MKKIFLAFLLICSIISAQAQYSLSSAWAAPNGSFANGKFPVWYTKNDSVAAAATDTFRVHLEKAYVTTYNTNSLNSITFTTDVWHVYGPTTVNSTVSLYGSANNGFSYTTAPITTYTVTPVNTYSGIPYTNTYMVNTPSGGNPYTDYMLVLTSGGTGTDTVSWTGSVLIR